MTNDAESRGNEPAAIGPRSWEVLATGVGLVALLLPATGAIATVISFMIAGIPPAVAVARPIGALAVDGALVVFLPAVVVSTMFFASSRFRHWRHERQHVRGSEHAVSMKKSGRGLLKASIPLLIWLGLGVVWVPMPFFVTGVVGGLALTLWMLYSERSGPLTFVGAVPLGIAFALAAAVASGVAPRSASVVAFVNFEKEGLSDGLYSFLGAEDAVVYLLPCADNAHLLRVREELVVSIELVDRASQPPPTVADLLTGTPLRWGFIPACPVGGVPPSPSV